MNKQAKIKLNISIFFILVGIFIVYSVSAQGSFDPEDERQIGYELLNDGKVVHIWNTKDDYFFNKSSGIQFSNHYENYWTRNIFCIGYYNGEEWIKIKCADELTNFEKSIETDNETYVNATLWKDITYGSYNLRLGINYYLGLNDENLSITIYGKNIGIDIPYNLDFAWRLTDIKIDNTYENDYIRIWNNTEFPNSAITTNLASEVHETYTNLNQTKFEMIDGSEYLRLNWNESLTYKLMIDSSEDQYNAPTTLLINVGLFDSGVEKSTTMYWIDAITNVSVSTGNTDDVWDTPLAWNHDIPCGENMVLIVGVCTDGPDPGKYIASITYNGTSLTRLGATVNPNADVDVEMWNLSDPDCGSSLEINVTWSEDSTEEAAGISTVYYGVDYIDNSTMQFNSSDEGDYSTLGITTTSVDEIVVDVFGVDTIPIVGIYGGDNQTHRGTSNEGTILVATSDAYDSDGTTKIGWEIDGDEFAHIAVALVPASDVAWNQSSHDFGETITNATATFEISSLKTNTDTKVDCTGHCTEITTNWTQRTMSDGQTDPVLITCSNATEGEFQAIFNVTSDEDTISNLFTVDCEVWSYGWLNVSIEKPDDNSEWYQNYANLTVNATVTCSGGSNAKCGNVSALARYNLTASPDTAINTTEGGEPFYMNWVREITVQPLEWNVIDKEADGAASNSYQLVLGDDINNDIREAALAFQFNSTENGTLNNITLNFEFTVGDDIVDSGDINISLCEFTDNLCSYSNCIEINSTWDPNWVEGWHTINTEEVFLKASQNYTILFESISVISDNDGSNDLMAIDSDSSENYGYRLDAWVVGGSCQQDFLRVPEMIIGYTKNISDVVGQDNPQSSPSVLNKGESYQFNWTLNVTTASTENYLIDVLFNSTTYYPSITENDTLNRLVKLNPSVEDTVSPKWFDNSTNGTIAGTYIEHRVRWTDAGLSGYIFEFDNGTGSFNNDSFITFTGTNNWSNVTKYVNETESSTIRWRVYANDTASPTHWNFTDIFQYDTTAADTCTYVSGNWDVECSDYCNITDVTSLPSNNLTLNGTGVFTILANITADMVIQDTNCQVVNLAGDNKKLMVV